MPNYIYPASVEDRNLTTEEIHILLSNPRVIARRIADITKQRYVADYLLGQRFVAQGGGVFYETGAEVDVKSEPEAVAPGAEYPNTTVSGGDIASASTVNWGQGIEVTDKQIAQEGMGYVNKRLRILSNSNVRKVDAVAMSVIASKVTSTSASSAWSTPGAVVDILTNLSLARAELGTGLDLSTIVLNGGQYAKLMGRFLDAGAFPREAGNPLSSGLPIEVYGFTFLTTPHYKSTDPLFVDPQALGGMADEKNISPDFTQAANGTEVKTYRPEGRDVYRLLSRRMTVPVVLEPLAGVRITGTGL